MGGGSYSPHFLSSVIEPSNHHFKNLSDFQARGLKHMNRTGFLVSLLIIFKSPKYLLLFNIV